MLIVGHDRFLTYNGSEFAGKAMDAWTCQYGVQLEFIRPGRPIENSYIESFNGRLRDECLNVETFFDLVDVREKLEHWRQDYNEVRPHSALADRSPEQFVRQWKQWSSAVTRTARLADRLPACAVQSAPASDPESITLFAPPSREMKGRAEKLPTDSPEQTAGESELLEVVN